jgi:hypothetical protein
MSTAPVSLRAELRSLQRPALGVGVVALVICIIGGCFSPTQFFRAYLAAYLFFLGLALGCMAILMVFYLTGGAWGYLSRRILEAGMRTLPLLTLLFVPLLFGVRYLYPWAQPAVVAASAKLQYQQFYLNVPYFWGRAGLYFTSWLLLAHFLGRWSDAEDRTGDRWWTERKQRLSAIGLVIYGIGLHFAAIDWVMSLQPDFHSTIFGPLVASGQLVSAQALVLIVLALVLPRPPLAEVVSGKVLNDLGNLLLSFLVIWAYMVWFQFMLIWIANLPVDIIWYLPRERGGWQWVALVLFVFHFAIPFFLLLMRVVKQTPWLVGWVAGVICFMQLVYGYYQVMPAFPDTTLADHWMDFLAPVGLGGLWLANFLWELGRRQLLPQHDHSREQAVHLRHIDEEEEAREEVLAHG